MAPPTRLRPHQGLNDLLQKNLELEHVVADLRHQLTQSAAKWADERKLLAVGCDTLMASFAKFRARLDIHHSADWGDSEGEVEQNLDAGVQGEETGEVDNAVLEPEVDQGSTIEDNLRERCHALAAELQVKEEELGESRRKHEAAEEELRRVQQSLEALTSAKAGTSSKDSPEHIPDDTLSQANPSGSEPEDALQKLDLANEEIRRLKGLLLQWQKYGNDWKREAQVMEVRVSEMQLRELELSTQIKEAERRTVLPESEREEIRRLTSALAEQTAAVEQQRNACQESTKRVTDLEAMVALLRAQLSPEQLASIDSEPTPGPSGPTRSSTPQADANPNKRSDMIMLKIPYRAIRKSPVESNGSPNDQQNESSSLQAPTSQSVPQSVSVGPALQTNDNPPNFNLVDYELCIHTCNPLPCRNEAQSFLWPRRLTSLPRHALSTKKHRHCTSACPGHTLLTMPVAEALKQPRRTKCRPPSEAEVTMAAEEVRKLSTHESSSDKRTRDEEDSGQELSGEAEEPEEPEGGLTQEEVVQDGEEEQSPRKSETLHLGKRLRSRATEVESQRARKLRSRVPS